MMGDTWRTRERRIAAALGAALLVLAGACGDDEPAGAPQVGIDAGPGDAGDGGGAAGTRAPTVTIVTPEAGALLPHEPGARLTAVVADDADPLVTLSVVWSSDRDGELGAAAVSATGLASLDDVALSPGGHVLVASATDADGMTGSATVAIEVNGPPSAPGVHIEPASPGTADSLEAVVSTPPSDPNRASDALTLTYAWLRDGQPVAFSGPTIPPNQTARGELWRVEVTARDGLAAGPAGVAEVTIGNSPPACLQAVLLPSTGPATALFTCTCADWQDLDGDAADGDTCAFEIDGEPVADVTGCTLPPETAAKGQEVRCAYIPSDGTDAGAPTWAEPGLVVNAPPAPPEVTLAPGSGGVVTEFTCEITVEAVDPDGDAVDYTYAWVVAGFEDPSAAAASATPLDLARDDQGAPARRGDALQCAVRAADDAGAVAAPVLSAPVVLGNSPPAGGAVLVSPDAATEATTLTCEGSGAADPDGDEVGWEVTWLVDGEVVAGETGATLTGEHFDKGQAVTCTAAPTDGEAAGPALDAKTSVVVANTLPALEEVTATPALADQAGEFTCAWSGWLDPDPADAPDVTFQWQSVAPDGTTADLADATGDTLAAAGFARGTRLRCVATPLNDGLAGTPRASEPVEVGNTLPSLTGATVSPDTGAICATWTCAAEGVDDPDDDSVLVAWRWTVGGVEVATGETLSGVALAPGDEVRCFARPTDGAVDGAGATLYGDEAASDPVTVANSAPSLDGATVEPDTPTPYDVATCEPGTFSDPDPCHADSGVYTFKWYVDGVELTGAADPTLALDALAPGDTVACQATPSDGFVTGSPALSAPVAILAALPIVEVQAPQGAAGEATCVLVREAIADASLSYTWLWTINDGTETSGPQTLAASLLTDCDHLTCRAVASTGSVDLESAPASLQLPLGAACDDGDPCTDDVCAAAGGCDHPAYTGPCDDGDVCTEGETCATGTCEGGAPATCDDGDPCTDDSCLAGVGCQHAPGSGAACGPTLGDVCVDGACCERQCDGRQCGDDGCGGVCGVCAEGTSACDEPSGQCVPAEPGMLLVAPAGPFWMGCNPNTEPSCPQNELPLHAADLPIFQIDEHEVTAGEYDACYVDFGCKPAGDAVGCTAGNPPALPDRPANCISWFDAVDYCTWAGKRLCTEAEWEKAARGTETPSYPWGNDLPTCNHAVADLDLLGPGCGTGGPLDVGSRPAGVSPFGLYDMSGNVWEWVADWYDPSYYDVAPLDNPQGPATGTARARRGGSFLSDKAEFLKATERGFSTPFHSAPDIGFRCCKDWP